MIARKIVKNRSISQILFHYRYANYPVLILLVFNLFSISCSKNKENFFIEESTIILRQVDYEGAIYYNDQDPYPHLDFSKVKKDKIVEKEHKIITINNRYLKLTLLPEMGRVYSFVFKPTGHEVFWHNDIVTVGGGNNDTGWWIWVGGAEYTLPGDEHGTTWAELWDYSILENSENKKTVRMAVIEKGSGLKEEIDISVFNNSSFYEAAIKIINPTEKIVNYAHWINPQWAPGGSNELTDNTEFIIPTDQILIPDRFTSKLGESPQDWNKSKLRFIKGWDKGWGDIMADGLKYGFYSAYSHDMQEGVVRVFDKNINPGVDIWTYGYHPKPPHGIPMGSGSENKGYAEMWGGTSKYYPDERHPIMPGEIVVWTEWMYPYQKTGGLKFANKDVSINIVQENNSGELILGICPSRRFEKIFCRITDGNDVSFEKKLNITPFKPYFERIKVKEKVTGRLSLTFGKEIIAVFDIE